MEPPTATALWVATIAAAVLSAFLVGMLSRTSRYRGFLDQPNARSLHSAPVGRLGGLGLFAAVAIALLGILIWTLDADQTAAAGLQRTSAERSGTAGIWPLTAGIAAVTVLIFAGAWDDRHDLAAIWRFVIQLLCSLFFITALQESLPVAAISLGSIAPESATILNESGLDVSSLKLVRGMATCALVLLLVWTANLYNFMDGANGIAGLTSVIGFGAFAMLAPSGGAIQTISAIVAGATAGFLVWNWSPARIFLGDAGSVPLGWAAGALGIAGVWTGAWPWFTPVLIFLPFLLDTTLTLLRRMFLRQRFWEPHRDHAYQRLVLTGMSHARVATLYAALMIPGIVTASTTRYVSTTVLFGNMAVIICCNAAVFIWAARRSAASRAVPP